MICLQTLYQECQQSLLNENTKRLPKKEACIEIPGGDVILCV